jgi:class 3 adenylate cyclase
MGRTLGEQFAAALDEGIVDAVGSAVEDGAELLGVQGIYRNASGEIDFALNVSPLKGKRGGREGATLLFTDQTAEQELKKRVDVAVEERRVIKDMFTRYLSTEVVETLMEYPDQVRPGGAKKNATIFFADIRGYTPFSEGKQPEYIIEVLNEYFSVAVEVIVRHHGFIDKFIGDAIMAAWGVPMTSEAEDATNAVSAALEIQQLIAAGDRTFFTGEAENLQVGIGMHTGPLVAGNLGSTQRMDYSVIGDTVNVAARLEGVAGGGEVIITQDTRRLVGDAFAVEELEPVRVKGKQEPIPIFSVLKKAS